MVMHARKPQRLNDGYFDKHQTHPYQSSKYSSKRDYEREASNRSSYLRGNDRDLSPNSSVPSGTMNGSSYRMDSPDLDSPRDRDRSDRYQSSSYIQKFKDRGRNDYKKDKYLDKRDRREEHRTNHDRIDASSSSRRSSKMMYPSSDKRSGSTDRDRDRSERERDIRDRERGSGSNNNDRDRDRVNSVGDWTEHISSSGKKYYYHNIKEHSQWEKPKEWLDKEKEKEKERMLTKEQHREYRDRERDRGFSRSSYAKHSSSRSSRIRWHDSDNVPTHRRRPEESQEIMEISGGDSTPTSEASYSHSSTPNAQAQHIADGPVLLANARLASHPPTPNNSQMNTSSSCTPSSSSGNNLSSTTSSLSVSSSSKLNKNSDINSLHNANMSTSSPSTAHHIHNSSSNCSNNHSGQHSSASPSIAQTSSSKKNHQDKDKLMGHSNDTAQHSSLVGCSGLGDGNNQIVNNNMNSNSLREHALHSPLYNYSHSMMNHLNSGNGSNNGQYVQSGMLSQSTGLGIGISSQFSAAGLKSDGSSTLNMGDGPPTPTQELDMTTDHRKMDGTSASLSSLSSQLLRHQGPSLTPSLANYFRADLIAHVTNWPAEILEKQAQNSSDEANIIGNLQCTKVSADLKSARSVVRITEITATLQEQKVMYLRQQIRRLEELKSQNSFMSEDL